ncbi:MAG: glycine dehydrogenase subunit 2 [Chloroflexota bacterium]|nr:MAG: glycine dehydrogenase subunit 2 [Chloroflexota bacterium]
MIYPERLLKELSSPGRRGVILPQMDVPESPLPPEEYLREDLPLPEVSELDVVTHFVRLSNLNYGVDTGFYPLGSCTMKYNPRVNEQIAGMWGFADIHPCQPEETVQGALQLMYELQEYLAEIAGMDATSLQPAAGAQGELTGILMARAHHLGRGDHERTHVIVPDSAHGTNPATAHMAGYEVITLRSDPEGNVDMLHLEEIMGKHVAALMLTLPNTLGLFDPQILKIAEVVHQFGGILYGDGANMNALLGQAKPGQLGFDILHLNLHKTFSTPHGGGGPGACALTVKDFLAEFLPEPVVALQETEPRYTLTRPHQRIGRMLAFHGNFGNLVRAYAYIRTLGPEGLRQVSENAVLNANYMQRRLRDAYRLPYDRRCMHEFVLSAVRQRAHGVRAWDIAKRLMDYGYHPPTVYFPLIVEEALMIEPTETEAKHTLDDFIAALLAIDAEAEGNPEVVQAAPQTTPYGRFDEAAAARKPKLHW